MNQQQGQMVESNSIRVLIIRRVLIEYVEIGRATDKWQPT